MNTPSIPRRLALLAAIAAGCTKGKEGDAIDTAAGVESTVVEGTTTGWAQVAVGLSDACALDELGSVSCWGVTEELSNQAPPDAMVQVWVGSEVACGRTVGGELRVWGLPSGVESGAAPAGAGFVDVACEAPGGCAIDASGHVECWGSPSLTKDAPTGDGYTDVVVRAWLMMGGVACATGPEARTICWGDLDAVEPSFFSDRLGTSGIGIDSGAAAVCLWAEGGFVDCACGFWGCYDLPFEVADFGVGDGFLCGISPLGDPGCDVGSLGDQPGAHPPEAVRLTDVSAGGENACGVTDSGTIVCWGKLYEIADVP